MREEVKRERKRYENWRHSDAVHAQFLCLRRRQRRPYNKITAAAAAVHQNYGGARRTDRFAAASPSESLAAAVGTARAHWPRAGHVTSENGGRGYCACARAPHTVSTFPSATRRPRCIVISVVNRRGLPVSFASLRARAPCLRRRFFFFFPPHHRVPSAGRRQQQQQQHTRRSSTVFFFPLAHFSHDRRAVRTPRSHKTQSSYPRRTRFDDYCIASDGDSIITQSTRVEMVSDPTMRMTGTIWLTTFFLMLLFRPEEKQAKIRASQRRRRCPDRLGPDYR